MNELKKKVSQKPEVNMLIVAMLRPEDRLVMWKVNKKFREHLKNAKMNYPLFYIIEMGGTKLSVRETTTVDLSYKNIKKIEGLDKASIFIENIWLGSNKIVTIEGLNKCKNLAKLHLNANLISKIPEGAFDGLVNL